MKVVKLKSLEGVKFECCKYDNGVLFEFDRRNSSKDVVFNKMKIVKLLNQLTASMTSEAECTIILNKQEYTLNLKSVYILNKYLKRILSNYNKENMATRVK